MRLPVPFALAIPSGLGAEIYQAEGEGIPRAYDIPVGDPASWQAIASCVDEGDEITLVALAGRGPVIEVAAIVLALHEGAVPSVEVIA